MKQSQNILLPADVNSSSFRVQLSLILINLINQINGLADGFIIERNSAAAAPTTGSANLGDIVYNNNPSELGPVLAKYVLVGWICTAAGSPGTWLQMRTLTGN